MPPVPTRAYYAACAPEFSAASPDSIFGRLALHLPFAVEATQREAWKLEIDHLKKIARAFPDAHLFLEFMIPRMGRRADAIVVLRGTIFVLEYKVGGDAHHRADLDQVFGYALDLKHFHETSHARRIVPVLIPTKVRTADHALVWASDDVAEPIRATLDSLPALLEGVAQASSDSSFDALTWAEGRYKPTPTIIEAAQALYRGHAVEEISRSEAEAENLSTTSNYLAEVIEAAKVGDRKAICLVTGVPGSGKTLAGLNLVNSRKQAHDDEHAVFLSGNGPLVDVLREALTQDALKSAKLAKQKTSREIEYRKACAFIQNIHHFRDEALRDSKPPVEKVVVFDEAQRAWNQEQTSRFMEKKRGQAGFSQSEPEFLLSVMDRNPGWCAIVCLVGGGQEINTGEAGLIAWLEALSSTYAHWDVHLPSTSLGQEYLPAEARTRLAACQRASEASALHLKVSLRSFRAERVAQFVTALIANDPEGARALLPDFGLYPIVMTRSLATTRDWLKKNRRGTERSGLVASSNALRLKPEGVFMRAKIEPCDWFLAPRGDVRSSDALEDVASEFDVQGLELDWIGVCWDCNLRHGPKGWEAFAFKGTRWTSVNDPSRQTYLLNAYRVLLSRARRGMIIYVPEGVTDDPTRSPAYYQGIAEYLRSCGIPGVDTE
jgi:hypothetical protein